MAKALDDKDAVVRRSAVAGLGWVGGEKAAALIGKALNDPDPEVRLAIEYCSCKSDDRVAEIWIDLTKDSDGRVRQLAANALGCTIGFDRYCKSRDALLAAVQTELYPGALDEQRTCLESYRDKARDILVKRLQNQQDFEEVKAIGRGARRILGHDPQIAKLLDDLHVPPGTAWDK